MAGQKMARQKSSSKKPCSAGKRSSKRVPWEQRFTELEEFKKKHGHCNVPKRWNENPQLGKWVHKQRFEHKCREEGKRSAMSDNRIALLESVGFEWVAAVDRKKHDQWKLRLDELKDYKRENGHCDVPRKWKENPQLGEWVSRQRRQYRLREEGKKSAMTDGREALLNSIGFTWLLYARKATSRDSDEDDDDKDDDGNQDEGDDDDDDDDEEEEEEDDDDDDDEESGDDGQDRQDQVEKLQAQIKKLQAETKSQAAAIHLLSEENQKLRFHLGHLRGEIERKRKESSRVSAESERIKSLSGESEGTSTRSAKRAKTLSMEEHFQIFLDGQDSDIIHDQVEKYLARHANPLLFPYFSAMRKAGVEIDPLWDPGVMHSGDIIVSQMPSPDEMDQWVQQNRNELNKKNDRVKIGHSEGRGKGLYAAKNIRATNLIGYHGGVRREQRRTHSTKHAFVLDNEGKWEINAEYCGGLTRYINAPNEGEEANVVASIVGDKIKITAKKPIKKGDELLLDYGPEYFIDPPEDEEED